MCIHQRTSPELCQPTRTFSGLTHMIVVTLVHYLIKLILALKRQFGLYKMVTRIMMICLYVSPNCLSILWIRTHEYPLKVVSARSTVMWVFRWFTISHWSTRELIIFPVYPAACTCPGESHPGPMRSDGSYVGRSAPEIDIFEATVVKGVKGQVRKGIVDIVFWFFY